MCLVPGTLTHLSDGRNASSLGKVTLMGTLGCGNGGQVLILVEGDLPLARMTLDMIAAAACTQALHGSKDKAGATIG